MLNIAPITESTHNTILQYEPFVRIRKQGSMYRCG